MAKVLLGVTGSVAAIYTRELFDELRGAGHDVKVVVTTPALHFFDVAQLAATGSGRRNHEAVILDQDEWAGERWERGDPVLHIELRRWAELLLIAPLDANTLAKMALGLCDNCLTCVYRAWDRRRPLVLAPAMNTLMWDHSVTARHLAQIAADVSKQPAPPLTDGLSMCAWINAHCPPLAVVPPVSKALACDDVGLGALAGRADILATVSNLLQRQFQGAS
jgi:phosphopantothenoylcysteine decarboxylase